MKIWLNNTCHDIAENESLAHLLEQLNFPIDAIVIAHQGQIVARQDWQALTLYHEMRFDVFQAIAGG